MVPETLNNMALYVDGRGFAGRSPEVSPAADDAIDLLADVFGRADESAGELARIADERGIAGQQCERSYDALKGDAQSNLPQ